MSKLNLMVCQVSASIIEVMARVMPRSYIRGLINEVNLGFKDENVPLKMTFSHGTKRVRVKEIK